MKIKKQVSVFLLVLIILTIFSGCGNPIENIEFSEKEVSVRLENTYQINYKITPENIENPKITWTSSDKKIATVNKTGLVTPVTEGEVVITATAKKDVFASLKVIVKPKFCNETEEIQVKGLYVDNSYKDKNGSNNKLLYMYYTVKSPKSNVKIDSKSTTIIINNNEYKSERVLTNADADEFSKNYYFSDYLKTVNVGENCKVMESFLIPSAELQKGTTITFSNSSFQSESELIMDTDSVEFLKNGKEVAKKADPSGYKIESNKRKKVSEAEARKVKNLLNGYYWDFYVNGMYHMVEFYSPNDFEITAYGVSNNGKYEVRKGYIYMKFKNTTEKDCKKIPYEIKNGDIELDIVDAYDVRE